MPNVPPTPANQLPPLTRDLVHKCEVMLDSANALAAEGGAWKWVSQAIALGCSYSIRILQSGPEMLAAELETINASMQAVPPAPEIEELSDADSDVEAPAGMQG